MNDKPVIDLSADVPANDSVSITETFDTDGYITHLHATAYDGEERDIVRKFRLWQGGKDNGNPIPLIRVSESGNNGLTGDNETWQLDMRRPVSQGDVLEAKYVNNGPYSFPVGAIATVEEDTGLIESMGGFL